MVPVSPKAAPKKVETESRDGVKLTNLDASLFEGAGATKRDLVDYLDAVHDRIIPVPVSYTHLTLPTILRV